MPQQDKHQGMIVFASEQLWPNIHGLVHWSKVTQLTDLCIYHTDDERNSKTPAQRLKNFCSSEYPSINIHLHEGKFHPECVFNQLTTWQQTIPADSWIINATGGLKLMFAGVLDKIGQPGVQVVYRELAKDWFELSRNEGVLSTQSLEIDRRETDQIPVESLVKAQSEWPTDADISSHGPRQLPVFKLTEIGPKHHWRWPAMFNELGIEGPSQGGFLFEQFVAATLLEMGVSNLIVNLVVRSQGGQTLQEIDVVANYHGRLMIIDCKLFTDESEQEGEVESITSQIRQAAETRSRLGGLGAKLLLLRPNHRFTADLRALANACRLEVLDQENCFELFTHLRDWLRVERLPETLSQAEQILHSTRKSGAVRVFSSGNARQQRLDNSTADNGVINLDHMLDEVMSDRNQNWVSYLKDGQFHVKYRKEAHQHRSGEEAAIRKLFRGYGSLSSLKWSHSGNTCRFILSPENGRKQEVDQIFAAKQNKKLLE